MDTGDRPVGGHCVLLSATLIRLLYPPSVTTRNTYRVAKHPLGVAAAAAFLCGQGYQGQCFHCMQQLVPNVFTITVFF